MRDLDNMNVRKTRYGEMMKMDEASKSNQLQARIEKLEAALRSITFSTEFLQSLHPLIALAIMERTKEAKAALEDE